MKKLLFLSLLFINLHAYSQAKIEAVIGASDTAPYQAIYGANERTGGIGDAIYGFTRTNGSGVQGRTYGQGAGVYGYSENNTGIGVHGFSESGIGVQGVGYFNNSIAGRFEHKGTGKALITIGGLRFGGNNVGTVTTGKLMKSVSNAGDAEWSDLVPYFYSGSSMSYMLGLENDNAASTSSTIYGLSNMKSNAVGAIMGIAYNADPSVGVSGIKGISYSNSTIGYGVHGDHYGYGSGVYGNSDTGTGGYFTTITGNALITNGGNVGIGVLAPNNMLDVNGRVRIRHTTNTAGIWMSNSTNSLSDADGAFYGMKTNTEAGIYIGNAWRFWVTSAGNATLTGTLTQSSDKRLKKDFSSLNNSLSGLYQLNGYHYKWIEDSRSKDLQTGLIAQEVQKIFPELVQTDEAGFLAVNYTGLVPHLIEAVKELRNENNALKGKNQTLESRLDKIEALLTAQQQHIEKMAASK
ncbi:tail fiber domain-containing protein [Emticicia soli]|uniref:Tail fiber domain-containing protein n=1 Tax=Emticicia soli TaxID=2027878 RepID=A0ABW5JDI0_9BACT